MTLKGTKTLGVLNIDRICNLATELERINTKYQIDVYPKTMEEYNRCIKVWAGFEEVANGLIYKDVTIFKPKV